MFQYLTEIKNICNSH